MDLAAGCCDGVLTVEGLSPAAGTPPLTKGLRAYATKVRVVSGALKQPDLPQQIFENLGREGIHVDILVNNAGFSFRGKWWTSEGRPRLAFTTSPQRR